VIHVTEHQRGEREKGQQCHSRQESKEEKQQKEEREESVKSV